MLPQESTALPCISSWRRLPRARWLSFRVVKDGVCILAQGREVSRVVGPFEGVADVQVARGIESARAFIGRHGMHRLHRNSMGIYGSSWVCMGIRSLHGCPLALHRPSSPCSTAFITTNPHSSSFIAIHPHQSSIATLRPHQQHCLARS